MAIEIEHKFLLADDRWRREIRRSERFVQGYLSSEPTLSVRVRICGENAWLNIKSATVGNRRYEYEYPIPADDADEILRNLCRKPLIEKIRHFVEVNGRLWEIDEFESDNQGLIVAEIELSSPDETFEKPAWVGEEVTNDLRFYNNQLVLHPYNTWK